VKTALFNSISNSISRPNYAKTHCLIFKLKTRHAKPKEKISIQMVLDNKEKMYAQDIDSSWFWE